MLKKFMVKIGLQYHKEDLECKLQFKNFWILLKDFRLNLFILILYILISYLIMRNKININL